MSSSANNNQDSTTTTFHSSSSSEEKLIGDDKTIIDNDTIDDYNDHDTTTTNQVKKKSYPPCEICSHQESKYTCPGCNLRYCCLECFKNHKTSSGCSGKRDVTKFIDLKDFSEQSLRSDYNFLENLDSQTIHWSRMRAQEKIDSHSYQYHHPRVRELQFKAIQKGIRMELMPQGMTRRENNTSYYNKKSDKIFWRLEFLFDQEIDGITNNPSQLVENHICEDVKIINLVQKYFDKTVLGSAKTRDKMQKYASHYENAVDKTSAFKYFIQVEGNNEVIFYTLDPSLSLRDALKNMVIIEYPIIHVVLSGCCSTDETAVVGEQQYRIISDEEMKEMNRKRDEKLKEKKEKRQAFIDKKHKYEERIAEKQSMDQKKRKKY